MEQRLKERLVGAAVLVAIAVIFIPIIFNDTPETTSISGTNIPEKPETDFSSRIIPMVETSQEKSTSSGTTGISTADEDHLENLAQDDTNVTQEPVVEKLPSENDDVKSTADKVDKLNADVGLSAWIVQLGSFSSEENAQSLKVKLREAGYPAFVEPINKSGQSSYRVRVGPEIKRSDAELLLQQLQDKMKLTGIVVAYP